MQRHADVARRGNPRSEARDRLWAGLVRILFDQGAPVPLRQYLAGAAWRTLLAVLLVLPEWGALASQADEETETCALEVVVTTATKKSQAEAAGDVPAAVSVLSSESLAARQVTDLEDLSHALPNVALDGIGTGKGIANFSIRCLRVAGSIPSIDPTVGVFVDGVYLGVNYGVVVDMLDLRPWRCCVGRKACCSVAT